MQKLRNRYPQRIPHGDDEHAVRRTEHRGQYAHQRRLPTSLHRRKNVIEKERSVCYHKIRREGNGKCSGTGAKPHSAVSSFQNGAARTAQGTAPMAPPLFGAEFIRRRQKRRKKARLSKMPSQPARDKGCGTRCPDTHNAACGIETVIQRSSKKDFHVPTHTMLRAALTAKRLCVSFRSHRAVFVCKKRTAILTMRRTDVRIEIQKGTAG